MSVVIKKKKQASQDNFLIEKLRTEVFAVPLLKQDKIFLLFVSADKIISAAVHQLLIASPKVRSHVYNTILKVASGNTYGRNIFEKGGVDKELAEKEKQDKPILKKMEVEFLERAFGLVWSCAKNEKYKIPSAFEKAMFIRGVYEECLEIFKAGTKDYKPLNHEASKFLVERSYEPRTVDKYTNVLKQLRSIEGSLKVNDAEIYGLISIVEEVSQKFAKIKEKILNPYLRIVYSTAKGLSKSNDQLLDNFQNGTLGLLRAVSCYSTKRPTTFSAVAKQWIRQMILLTIKEDANFVKLPISTWQAYTVLEKAKSKLESGKVTGESKTVYDERLGHEKQVIESAPSDGSDEELAETTKMPISKIRSVYDSVKVSQVYSLNRTFDDEDKLNLTGVLIDKDAIIDEALDANLESVFKAIKDIPKNVLISLALSYGIVDSLPQTIPIGEEEIKIEAIRQLCFNNLIFFVPYESMCPKLKIVK